MSLFASYPYNHAGENGLEYDAIMNEDENEADVYRNYRSTKAQ